MNLSSLDQTRQTFYMILGIFLVGFFMLTPQGIFAQEVGEPNQVGLWEEPIDLGLEGIHLIHLPTGKILMWDEPGDAGVETVLFDPVTGVASGELQPLTFFCAGHAGLPDGRVLVAGGILNGGSDISTAIFDPFTETWTQVENMNYARYYPTLTTLSDGRVIVLGGTHSEGKYIPEVFDPGSGVWTAWPGAYENMRAYPRAFLTPDGQVMNMYGSTPPILNIETQTWGELSKGVAVFSGSGAMYEPGKIVHIGTRYKTESGDITKRGTAVMDLNQPAPAFQGSNPTEFERYKWGNLTLLPDGSVLATGGTNKAKDTTVYAAELWDPDTETWTTLSSAAFPRLYHSTAVLLEDGRVLTAGGDEEHAGQIFNPPYLFKGPRPNVGSAPSAIGYGETFHVSTADPAGVAKISLLRLGAVTHTFDQNQRFMWLNFVAQGDGFNIQEPAGPTIAPPGAYALFLISDEGVPSLASYIIVGDGLSPEPPSEPPVEGGENWSENAVASASSTFDETFQASLAIDGLIETGWRPAIDFPSDNWLELNFGTPRTFGTVVIEDQAIQDYDLQYHDGTEWVTIISGSNPGFDTFPPVTASRIRIVIRSTNNIDQVRIWEFDVWSAPLNCEIDPGTPTQIGIDANFSGNVQNPPPGLTYDWNFGDGMTESGQTVAHPYQVAGNYYVTLTVQNGASSAVCTQNHVAHNPLTANRPTQSSTIVYHTSLDAAVNVNPDNDTVSAVSTAGTKLWEAPVGDNPSSIAIAPSGELWVVNREDATVSVLDATTGAALATYNLPRASRPYGIAFSPNGSAAYVTLEGTGELVALDPAGTITGSLSIGPKPRAIGITTDSSRIFVAHFLSPASQGIVTEVSASTFTVARSFTLEFDTTSDSEVEGRGVPNYLNAVVISPDGTVASVPSKKDNTARGEFRDGQPLTFENTVRAIVSQLDLVNNLENLDQRVDLDDSNLPSSVAYNKYGNQLFVALLGSNRVEVRDAYKPEERLGIVGEGHDNRTRSGPLDITFNNDFSILFVHNFLARTVSLYNVSGFADASDYSGSELAVVDVVANEMLNAKVLLGKQIFYDSSDTRMSRDGYLSCASCHLNGMSDERVWDFTDRGEGFRNTISLLGRRGTGHGNLHWTANFDEVQDFENDIRNAFFGTGLMEDGDFLAGTRSDPLGDPKAGLSSDLDALAAYVTSLVKVHPSPYRTESGDLTSNAEAGRVLFEGDGNCSTCHSGPDFTDTLRHDVGTIQPHSGQGIGQTLEGIGFDTPTLLGIWETAPYLHDGSAATLYDVIENPNHGTVTGFTAVQKDQLVAFLNELSPVEGGGGGGTNEVILTEAEDYNLGGEGIAYHDLSEGNQCKGYRQDDVDIKIGRNGVTYICRTRPTEWLAYDISFEGGFYELTLRVANKSNPGNALHLKVDGVDVTGSILLPVTGGHQNWTTITHSPTIPLTAGDHQITVYIEGEGFSLDWWQLASAP